MRGAQAPPSPASDPVRQTLVANIRKASTYLNPAEHERWLVRRGASHRPPHRPATSILTAAVPPTATPTKRPSMSLFQIMVKFKVGSQRLNALVGRWSRHKLLLLPRIRALSPCVGLSRLWRAGAFGSFQTLIWAPFHPTHVPPPAVSLFPVRRPLEEQDKPADSLPPGHPTWSLEPAILKPPSFKLHPSDPPGAPRDERGSGRPGPAGWWALGTAVGALSSRRATSRPCTRVTGRSQCLTHRKRSCLAAGLRREGARPRSASDVDRHPKHKPQSATSGRDMARPEAGRVH